MDYSICILVEKFKSIRLWRKLPEEVWQVLADLDRENAQKMSKQDKIRLSVQAIIAVWLIFRLSLPPSGCRLDWFKCDYSCNNLYRCN